MKKVIFATLAVFALSCMAAPMDSASAASIFSKTKTYATDSAITATLKAKFLDEEDLDSLDIKVETTKGIVTLRGQVATASQASLAEKIARETEGVRGVKNKISVMP